MKLYLSGPMTGIHDYNYPEFDAATKRLRDAGFEVVSPAEMDRDRGDYDETKYDDYLAEDLEVIQDCDGIALLPGWEHSRGARIELAWGKRQGTIINTVDLWLVGEAVTKGWESGMPNLPKPPLVPYAQTAWERAAFPDKFAEANEQNILQEAEGLIHGNRQKDYGHPYDDFTRTAGMWSAAFGWKVSARDIPKAMILVKISRSMQREKRDNAVDMAGYAGTLELAVERDGGWDL